ncbi:double-strand break repair protein AddB [Hyphomonas sp. UBA4494]|jgi:ATP-dependent helicase/nuclease subunit B|uniref:double-strand break repair protein AddB n=1 Tax=Hyphomonas sp. UBA4494 TaxID=1946631 RepID=UPI0025B85145|nr:double-strand break repair protein AddB [Hyphomonas sp. UBA4494]
MARDPALFGVGAPKVWSIPPGENFLKCLAAELARAVDLQNIPNALADATIYVPNRRSARKLSAALFLASNETPILSPDIRAMGDLESDEAPPVAEFSVTDLPPALAPAKRLGTLASLVQAYYRESSGMDVPPSSALAAANELARLLDQAHLSPGADWSGLADLAKDADLAQHWENSAKFLEIITDAWPKWLEEQGVTDPLQRRLLAAEATAEAWLAHPPEAPVIIAGSTGATPAGRVLMKAALQLPMGLIVLPGLDSAALEEHRAGILSEVGHPQNTLLNTLVALEIEPGAVAEWPGIEIGPKRDARRRMIMEALAPADATADWRDTLDQLSATAGTDVPSFARDALEGLSLVEAADESAEASAIALMMRETLEAKDRTAALVTPDAGLARRVSALLKRWSISVPPSAGIPVGRTAAGSFVGLCAKWAVDPGDPVLIVAVLTHELAAPVDDLADFELHFLRGPRRWKSLQELVESIRTRDMIEPYPQFGPDEQIRGITLVESLIARFEHADADLSQIEEVTGDDAIQRIAALAESVSQTPMPWAGEDGAATSRLLEFVREVSESLGPMRPAALADLVNAQASQMTVSFGEAEHPQLSIWGPLEARLQSADRVILAGLNEDVWPKRPAPDAFLPRHFRARLGLGDPEERMGLAAHDFAQLACAPDVALVYASRRNDAPAVASRWVWRLKTLAEGALENQAADHFTPTAFDPIKLVEGLKLNRVNAFSDFSAEPTPSARPEGWPARLSATRVDLLQRDPYALWAEQVLGLSSIDALNDELGPAPRGTAIHRALELFEEDGNPKTAEHLMGLLRQELLRVGEPGDAWAAREAVWRRTVDWFMVWRSQRDTSGGKLKQEVKGSIQYSVAGQPFTLSATADRIEQTARGDLVIVDFKTGSPPRDKEVATGLSQQMPLQALIAQKGGYDGVPAARVDQLHYVAFKAKPDAFSLGGKHNLPTEPADMATMAEDGLLRLIEAYREPSSKFLSAPRVKFVKYDNGYNLLARRAEWAGDTEDGEGGDA